MPPLAIAAGIGAAASIGTAAIGAGAARSAARTQAAASQAQIAEAQANRDYQYNLNAPTINNGNRAGDLYAGFIGAGGDPAKSAAALEAFRGSTGYGDLVTQGMNAVNTNFNARGLGDSGAAYKALQDRATQIANSSGQQWLGNLDGLAQRGDAARGLVAGVGTTTTGMINSATQSAADAKANASLASGSYWSNAVQNLANLGQNAFGSSYGKPKTSATNSNDIVVNQNATRYPLVSGI